MKKLFLGPRLRPRPQHPGAAQGAGKREGGISHVYERLCTGTRKPPPLKWGNTTHVHVRGQDKKSFGDQGILSFEQTIKRDDRTGPRRTIGQKQSPRPSVLQIAIRRGNPPGIQKVAESLAYLALVSAACQTSTGESSQRIARHPGRATAKLPK